MSDDTTTREAVERVRIYAWSGLHYPADVQQLLAEFDRVTHQLADASKMIDAATRERDAATTAERDRIRRKVAESTDALVDAGAMAHFCAIDVQEWNALPESERAAHRRVSQRIINAALADVARIIDAEDG